MASSATSERILDTAENLFARKGFAETSLRAITSKADVNLAAVNYHFGSKEALIQAVFERFLTPFCSALEEQLDELEAEADTVTLERLLSVVSVLALGSHGTRPERARLFFRLSGLAYTQAQEHLRAYLREEYGALFQRFLDLLGRAAPEVPPMEMFWRVHFALGATIFTLSGMDSLQAICAREFGEQLTAADVNERLLAFTLGGLRGQD